MRAVNRDVSIDELAEKFMRMAGPRSAWAPKKAVMHNQEIGLCSTRHCDGGEAGVDRSRDTGDGAAVLHLQTVDGSVIVANGVGMQGAVAVRHDSGQAGFAIDVSHGRSF